MINKIVILGPESTGKSTLCTQLADHYKTMWCPEYAREYLTKNGSNYTYEDLLEIAKGQIAQEDEYFRSMNNSDCSLRGSTCHLFIDTDMYVMKVWSEFVFEKCHRFILQQIVERQYDLYLLCNIDLPWVNDELREYPDLSVRTKLFSIYKDIMINQSVPWVQIDGDYEQRLKKAVVAIDQLFSAG